MKNGMGLTSVQVQQRQVQGLSNRSAVKTGRTEKEIVLAHCLTYFNLVFVVLAAVQILLWCFPCCIPNR